MRISDCSSDVCSSDLEHGYIDRVLGHQIGDELVAVDRIEIVGILKAHAEEAPGHSVPEGRAAALVDYPAQLGQNAVGKARAVHGDEQIAAARQQQRSEEHTSELQSLMRISYAVFCLKKKK